VTSPLLWYCAGDLLPFQHFRQSREKPLELLNGMVPHVGDPKNPGS